MGLDMAKYRRIFLEEGTDGDTDIYLAAPGQSEAEAVFVGPGQQRFADQLVDGVVTSHVLTQAEQRAAGVEQACGVQPSGAFEHGLRLAQLRR